MQRSIPKLHDYGMSPAYGFLPPKLPSTRLSDPYYSAWEAAIADLPELISKKSIRSIVNALPILSTSHFVAESEWQRAYVLLCFVAHGYIWSEKPPAEKLPPQISIPLLEVSTRLGTLPVISYAALCLWNFRPLQGQDIRNPDNLVALHTFTGTPDESWFHIMSVAVEAVGAPIVPSLLSAMEAARIEDVSTLTVALRDVGEVLGKLGPLLHRTNENLSPRVFYHDIRPFLAGSKSLPRGLIYDNGLGSDEYYQYGGASAAQSPLFHFCDIVLGIEHGQSGDHVHNFVNDIRNYMAGSHRNFVADVKATANVKPFVQTHQADSELVAAYGECIGMLKAFRSEHIGIVTRYIVLPSGLSEKKKDTSDVKNKEDCTDTEITGSAGTALIPFLKQMRDETSER
jgi:indoleamine 2,3-dioxygenase